MYSQKLDTHTTCIHEHLTYVHSLLVRARCKHASVVAVCVVCRGRLLQLRSDSSMKLWQHEMVHQDNGTWVSFQTRNVRRHNQDCKLFEHGAAHGLRVRGHCNVDPLVDDAWVDLSVDGALVRLARSGLVPLQD